jgi:hypothetical protein
MHLAWVGVRDNQIKQQNVDEKGFFVEMKY